MSDTEHALRIVKQPEPNMLECALEYARRGWPVFPCKEKSKQPATQHGFKDATIDENQITAWWTKNPNFNIGIATGSASGLFVFDVDQKPGRTLDEALEAFPKLPDAPTVLTGGGGYQYFWKYHEGSDLSISGGKLGVGIDTRGRGGYVVVPPSLHPTGQRYRWYDLEEAPLPETPKWVVERLGEQTARATLTSAEKLTGGRHDTLMTAAALMRGSGFVYSEIYAALDKLRNRLDVSDGRVIDDKELHDIASWVGGKDMGVVNIEAVTHGSQVAASLAKQASGAAIDEMIEPPALTDPGDFPSELLAVPGLVADMATYIGQCSHKKQPLLAMMASVAMVGAIVGRKVRTENDSRSNLYFVGLCKTGGGKDAARKAIKAVLFAAGADQTHLMPEKIASEAAVLTYVRMRPSALFLIDEIGRTLQAINGKNASSHEVGIITILMELFTSANSIYLGKAYADARLSPSPPIHNPNACLYSTSNPGDFYAALTGRDVASGFVPRMIVAEVDDHNPAPIEDLIPPDPPADLVDQVKAWMSYDTGSGNLSGAFPRPRVVMATAEAKASFRRLERTVRKEMAGHHDEAVAALWSRVVEKAYRLALVYACSRSIGAPTIDAEAAQWACRFSEWVARKMVFVVDQHVAENETESTAKRILRIVGEKADAGLSRNELTRKTQWLKKRDRDEHVSALTDSGLMVLKEVKTATKSRLVYLLQKYAK